MIDGIRTDGAPRAIGAYSQAVATESTVYVSGQLGLDPQTGEMAGSFRDQAVRALANVMAILEAAGSGPDRVLKTTVYLDDIHDLSELNELYKSVFKGLCPSREVIQAACLPRDAKIEISAIAGRGAAAR